MAFLLLQGIGAIGVLIALLTLLSPVRRYCGVRVLGGSVGVSARRRCKATGARTDTRTDAPG